MCYRCGVCKSVSEPREKRNLWPVPRRRGHTAYQEIAYEVPVCYSCYSLLQSMAQEKTTSGMELAILMKCHGKSTRIPAGPPQKVLQTTRTTSSLGGEDVEEEVIEVRQKQYNPNPNHHHVEASIQRCDVCGEPAVGGQMTSGTILCVKHAKKARGK